jgi:hypothetical protein
LRIKTKAREKKLGKIIIKTKAQRPRAKDNNKNKNTKKNTNKGPCGPRAKDNKKK